MKMSTGRINSYPGIQADKSLWFVEVMNYGHRPVTISSLPGFEFDDGSRFVLTPLEYMKGPQTVAEGQKVTYWMYEDALIEGLRKENRLPGCVMGSDDAGNTHRWKIDKKSLGNMKRLVDETSKEQPK
jgi:hypothetical protein